MAKAKQPSDGDKKKQSGGPRRRGLAKTLLLYALSAAVWIGIAGGLAVTYFALDLPAIDEAVLTRRPNVVLVDEDQVEIASVGDIYRGVVNLDELPKYVPAAFISVEDRRFYSHGGIDVIGLARAAWSNLRSGHVVQGGSTITQQVAKNLFLTPERTFSRKIREALLAEKLERAFTKDQILTIYLNRVYLGAGTYGLEAASERYFGRPAKDLTVFQAAVLAGLLRAPSRYSPSNDPVQAASRAAVVLSTMVETGAISAAASKAALAGGPASLKAIAAASAHAQARYFVDWILSQVDGFVGAVDRDLIITTTLDTRLQHMAETALDKHLAESGAKLNVEQGAVVTLSPDGAVRAMVGGRSYTDSQFNRATQALRQPGSSFKPIVFLAGIEAGYSPDDIVTDGPISIGGWRPQNFSGKYEGQVTVETALAKSLNTATVRIAEHVGPRAIVAVAHRLGITEDIPAELSIALGSSEVTLLELAGAYTPFANGGEGVTPYGIDLITERSGKVLYRREPGTNGQVIPTDEVGMMNRMMRQVLMRGTGTAAEFGFPAAGKTGTSSDFRDAWFMGFTTDYVTGVWVGNDSGEGMKGVTGGGLPAHIWHDVMSAAHAGREPHELPGL
ncbi:MAG: PBP1A family penicillin-binding protein, partial [Rhodospirillaceae bacterium]